jgi:hypothetical protein
VQHAVAVVAAVAIERSRVAVDDLACGQDRGAVEIAAGEDRSRVDVE